MPKLDVPTSTVFRKIARQRPQVAVAELEQIECDQAAAYVVPTRMQQCEIGDAAVSLNHAFAIVRKRLDGSRRAANTIVG